MVGLGRPEKAGPLLLAQAVAVALDEQGVAVVEQAVEDRGASRPSWNVQRWWWSLLARRVDSDWLAEWVPPRTEFPSGKRARGGDRAIGGLPLNDLAELVARRCLASDGFTLRV